MIKWEEQLSGVRHFLFYSDSDNELCDIEQVTTILGLSFSFPPGYPGDLLT